MDTFSESTDWAELLNKVDQLYSDWLNRTEVVGKSTMWLRGVIFGIEIGRNTILDEVAKPEPAITAVLSNWKEIGSWKETGPGKEAAAGLDYGIGLVIACVCEFLNLPPPQKPPRSAHGPCGDGNQTEEVS